MLRNKQALKNSSFCIQNVVRHKETNFLKRVTDPTKNPTVGRTNVLLTDVLTYSYVRTYIRPNDPFCRVQNS